MSTQLSVVPKTIDDLKHTITEEWQRLQKAGIAAFIRIGDCILDAEEQLGSGTTGYHRFLNELPFSYSHAVKFKALAQHSEIRKTTNWDKLPSSIFTLYQISLLDTKDVQDALRTKEITPNTTRQQIASHRQQVAHKNSYQPFCTILISSSLTPKDRASLIASASTAIAKYPDLTFKLSKEVKKEGLAQLWERAEKEYDRLVAKYPPKDRQLASLVDHAIEAIRKSSNKTLPTDFGRRDQLKRDLDIDTSQEIRQAELYTAARQYKVICRFLPLAKHDPYLKLWASVIEWCDTGNPKKLQRFADEKMQGKPTPKTTKKKDAMAQARKILDEHHAFISA
jgi:hypothetical protein